MSARTTRRAAVVGLVAVASPPAGAVPAQAAPGDAESRGVTGCLTVNAVRLTLLAGAPGSPGGGDLVLSSATCGPAGPPVPPASGAGLWPALGLLAPAGVPSAAVALHRRRGCGVV